MEKTPKLSIIVPVYNVEHYVKRCLDSIKNQTFKDYECIIIDDGSKDSSGSICDEYAAMDDRFIVIHQENTGLSGARNAAMKIVRGDYIAFVDSDDWLASNAYSVLFSILEKNNSQIAMCDFMHDGDYATGLENTGIRTYSAKEFTEKILVDEIGSQLWKFIYEKELWAGIESPARRHVQDMMILHEVTNRANLIVTTDQQLYGYNDEREDNITNKKSNIVKNMIDRSLAFIIRTDFCLRNNFSGKVLDNVVNQAIRYAILSFSYDGIYEERYLSDRLTIREYIEDHWVLIKKAVNRRDYLIRAMLIMKCPKLYTKTYNLFFKKRITWNNAK